MYCSNCGNELSDKAVVCPQCGCIANKTAYEAAFNAVKNENNNVNNNTANIQAKNTEPKPDVPNPAFSLLSFFMPLFGIVIYFADRQKTPNACKRYLLWSIVSIVLIVLFYIIYIGVFVAVTFLAEGV